MLYCLFYCVTNHTLYGKMFHFLDDAMRSSTRHGCRQEICIKETQTNTEDSERDTECGMSNRRMTPTGQDKTRRSYLIEGLPLSYGCDLAMKSLT